MVQGALKSSGSSKSVAALPHPRIRQGNCLVSGPLALLAMIDPPCMILMITDRRMKGMSKS
jgi:hypothetical protein